MDAKRFDEILHATINSTVATLASKAEEYAKGDRLYNFKRAALILDTTPEKALAGMIVKHLVSVLDLIEGTLPATEAMLNDKIGDTINYLVLLKALLIEKRSQMPQIRSLGIPREVQVPAPEAVLESMVKDGGIQPKNLSTKPTRVDLT
jgi:hypothetical protein